MCFRTAAPEKLFCTHGVETPDTVRAGNTPWTIHVTGRHLWQTVSLPFASHAALNFTFQSTLPGVRGGLLRGCGSQTSFLNHGRHRPGSVKQLYPPVPLSGTCIWLKYSAWLPALPCMYNYRICCLPLITLPNNVWRGRRRWIPNEVWKRLIKIAMVKSQRTSVCSALADQGRWEDRLCAWDSKLFFLALNFWFLFWSPIYLNFGCLKM